MKKGKILVVGLIGLLMVGGLLLTGCGSKCNGKCKVAFDENGKRFEFSSIFCGNGDFTCANSCNVVENWSNGSKYKQVNCDCK